MLRAHGCALLQHVQATLEELAQARERLRNRHGAVGGETFRIATGRTLARTLVADWLAALCKPRQPLHGQRIEISTRSMADVVTLLERGEVDMVCCYEHPVASVRLSGQRFRHVTLAHDRLVPVSRADANGRPLHRTDSAPLIAYAASLSLGALLHDHLRRTLPDAGQRTRCVCDSPDAIHELVRKGVGAAWLPWSMVAGECRARTLVPLGGRSDEVHFDVRLYRPRARQSALVEAVWAAADR